MALKFEFATAGRILFGDGSANQLGGLARSYGDRALVMTGGGAVNSAVVFDSFQRDAIAVETWQIFNEPTVDDVREAARFALKSRCSLVVGIGGGSVMDAAKAVAAMMTNPGDPLDYLEVIGKGKAITNPAAPMIAIPTTAGTGSEVTRNAVLTSPSHRVKVSMRSPWMLPRIAIVDPEMTYSLPPDVTAASGMDALTQVLEPFVSSRANPLVDGLCRTGLMRVGKALRRAYHDGQDQLAREDMSLVSLSGGMALANAGLGAVHGFAGPIGGAFSAPHGAVCAALLAPVTAANIRALQDRQPENPVLQKYQEAVRLLTGNGAASLEDGIQWMRDLQQELHIPSLNRYGIQDQDLDGLVEKSAAASSMKTNPIQLTNDEMREILAEAL